MKLNKEQLAYLEENLGKTILPLSIFENEDWPGAQPIEVLLYYKLKEWTFEQYQESFLKAADHFNLFSSRMIKIDDDQYALHYCTDGVEFHHLPSIDKSFNEIDIEDIKKKIVRIKTLPGEPLLSLAAMEIKDGWLGGVSVSHAVGDGISLIYFLYVWGCIIEGKDPKTFPIPSTQRLFKGRPVSSDKIDKVFTPPLSELNDVIQNRVKSKMEKYTIREYFTDEFFNEHKKKAKLENEDYNLSSNQIVTCYLLKKYHDHVLPHTDRIRLLIPIDLREIHPDVDSLYIGNAVFDGFIEFTKDEINKMSVYEIAYRLKEAVIKARSKDLITSISQISPYGITFKAEIFKSYRPYNVERDIVSSNMTHLNDLEALGIGEERGKFVYIAIPNQTSFVMLKEKSGRIFAEISGRYPLK